MNSPPWSSACSPSARSNSSGEKSSVSPACGTRFTVTTTVASVDASALPSSCSSRCGITLVNHDPGPSTTTSASRTASTACAHAGAPGGSSRTLRTRPGVVAIEDCPRMRRVRTGSSGSKRSTSAIRSSGTGLIGSTLPTAPTSSATCSMAPTGSPERSRKPVSSRLPIGCPASAPLPPNRCCSRSAHCAWGSDVSASAVRAMRRSPGGSVPSSRRMRPDEPPSSATVTTAVRLAVSRRSADSDAESPCPPPSATARNCSLTAEVPVDDGGPHPDRGEPVGELAGHDHRPVLAARAADSQREVMLALAGVARPDDLEQLCVPVDELSRALLRQHVIADLGVLAGQITQLGNPERVGQESHVGHQVGVGGQAVLIAERDDGGAQDRPALEVAAEREGSFELAAQLVNRPVAGVDHEVRLA